MGEDTDRGIAPESLEPGHTYRVDHKHVQLRRTFRLIGTYVGTEQRPPYEAGGEPVTVLVFEVKPRFGKPGRQVVDVSQVQSIGEP
jgi:hypothetical protein